MSIRRKGLVAAMEEEVLDQSAGGEEVPAEMVEVSDVAGDVAEDGAEITDLDTAIEEAEEDAETLVEVHDQMADSVEGGEGLPPEAAEMAEIVVESICSRLGIQGKVMPATESFGSANSRLTATKVAMEGVWDKVVQIWEAIKDAIKNLWNKIVSFIKKIFNGNLALEKAAKAMKDKVNKLKKLVVDEDNFEDSSIGNAFPSGDKGVNKAVVDKVLSAHVAYADNSGKITGIIESNISSVNTIAKGITVNETIVKQLLEYMVSGTSVTLKEDFDDIKGPTNGFLVNGQQVVISGTYKHPTFQKEQGSETQVDESGEFNISFSFDKADSADFGTKVNILTKTEMISICEEIIKLAKANDKIVKNIEQAEKKTKELDKAIDKLITELQKNENASVDEKKNMKVNNFTRKVVSQTSTKIGSFGTAIAGKNLQAGKAALRYVGKCYGIYAKIQ